MAIKEILELENKRKEKGPSGIVYLFPEGTFYRAYEWSAWLACRYINSFKATRRELKSEEGGYIVFVGFPIASLEKYTPKGAEVEHREDQSVAITLPNDVFTDYEGAESVRTDFENWKQSVPLPVKKNSFKDDLKVPDTSGHRMSETMLRILAFPIEQRTPMECMAFLAEMKQQLSAIL